MRKKYRQTIIDELNIEIQVDFTHETDADENDTNLTDVNVFILGKPINIYKLLNFEQEIEILSKIDYSILNDEEE